MNASWTGFARNNNTDQKIEIYIANHYKTRSMCGKKPKIS